MDHKNKIILQADGKCAVWQLKSFLVFFKRWEYVGEFTSIQDALEYLYGED